MLILCLISTKILVKKFSLTANLGSSYNDRLSNNLSAGGYLKEIANLFSIANFRRIK